MLYLPTNKTSSNRKKEKKKKVYEQFYKHLPFKVFSSHKWLVATLMDSADTEYFHHHRKECCLEYAKFKEYFSSETAIPLCPLYCLQGETPFSQLSQIRLFSMCVLYSY